MPTSFMRSFAAQMKSKNIYLFRWICASIFLLNLAVANAQETREFHFQKEFKNGNSFFKNDLQLNKKRKKVIIGSVAGGYTVAGLYLGFNWYAGQNLVPFHFFNDSGEWLQIDKGGHTLGAYTSARWMIGLQKWAGVEKKEALIVGGVTGFLAMSSVEVFDGFGEEWGFSWSDIAANFGGASLAVGNQLLWNEDRIQLKVSWQKSAYADVDSLQRLFGANWVEWILKDYNGHSIWMSMRVHSFLPEGNLRQKWPRWLNLAVGYGAEGLIGGYGRDPIEEIRAREFRQYYIGLDIDFANIKTRSGLMSTVLSALNFIHVPMPGVEMDQMGMRFGFY